MTLMSSVCRYYRLTKSPYIFCPASRISKVEIKQTLRSQFDCAQRTCTNPGFRKPHPGFSLLSLYSRLMTQRQIYFTATGSVSNITDKHCIE